MSPETCIYCAEVKAAFNREHALPRGLGTFEENLVLHRAVCEECNHSFGRHLDLFIARGSLEAVRRLSRGIRQPSAAADLHLDRMEFRAVLPGRWNRVVLRLIVVDGALTVAPVPQVGFRTAPSTEYTYLTEDQIRDGTTPLPQGPYPDDGIHIVSADVDDHNRLCELLTRRGISFEAMGQTPPPLPFGNDILVEIKSVFDDALRRCVSKIAFNYLAWTSGKEFCLSGEFNDIRRFVRYGERPGYRLIRASTNPILYL